MSHAIAIVCEHADDFRTVSSLTDKVLLEHVDWLDGNLESARLYSGYHDNFNHLVWTSVDHLCDEAGIRIRGRFAGELPKEFARKAKQAFLLLGKATRKPDAIILSLDQDKKTEKREGVEQARSQSPSIPTVVAYAIPKQECWYLSGFDPETDAETARLAAVMTGDQAVPDPRTNCHELTAADHSGLDKRDAKRVLKELTNLDADRLDRCLTDLVKLRQRGSKNGLRDFLDELGERLVPLFTGHRKI